MKRPNSMRHLDDAIRRACGGSTERFIHARTIMANALVASMLPDGVIKGGSALKMRFGDAATRFTTDLDTASATNPELYALKLSERLMVGWEGFSGRVVEREPASPDGIPEEYVMQPYDVKLTFLGKPWCTVPLEIGHNEIGDADKADWVELTDVAKLFEEVGFPAPGKVPLMPLEYQIAQKIHAVTSTGDRARDLVDLQLISRNCKIDFGETKKVCTRLFAYRKAQEWPPLVVMQPGWENLYAEQASNLPVLQDIESTIEWTNSFIQEINDTK